MRACLMRKGAANGDSGGDVFVPAKRVGRGVRQANAGHLRVEGDGPKASLRPWHASRGNGRISA